MHCVCSTTTLFSQKDEITSNFPTKPCQIRTDFLSLTSSCSIGWALFWRSILDFYAPAILRDIPPYYIVLQICAYVCTARPVNDATIGSTQVAPMCASCVLPRKVAFVVWVFDSALIGSDGCYLRASCMLPACFLLYYYPSFPSKLNWTETHTIWSTFLGSMQEAHMGATCVLPSVASLTGRAVCTSLT